MNEKLLILLGDIVDLLKDVKTNDLMSLSTLHTAVQDLQNEAKKEQCDFISKVALKLADILESIVLGEIKKPEESIEVISKSIDILSSIVVGEDVSSLELPTEIGISLKELQSEPIASTPKIELQQEENTENTGGLSDKTQKEIFEAIDMDSALVADFVAESKEHLEISDEALLTIDDNPKDAEALDSVFRAFHTIKGVAGFLNLTTVRMVAHEAENLLDKGRNGEILLDGEALDATFESVDKLKDMMNDLENSLSSGESESTVEGISELIAKLQQITSEKTVVVEKQAPQVKQPKKEPVIEKEVVSELINGLPRDVVLAEVPKFAIEVDEHLDVCNENLLDLEKDPDNKEVLNSLFRCFHSIKGSASFLELTTFEKFAHEAENVMDLIREGKLKFSSNIFDTIFDATDIIKTMNESLKIALENDSIQIEEPAKLARIQNNLHLIVSGQAGSVNLNETASLTRPLPVKKADIQPIPKQKPQSKTTEVANKVKKLKSSIIKETVKVDSDRLYKLVDAIGELVIAETMIVQSDEMQQGNLSPLLEQNLNHLDKITRELQEMGTSLRMVPIRSTFQKMARLIRDLSKKMKKDIEFVMNGEDTELDKTVVDKIGDPLVHMIRNSIDHGIEATTEERIKNGKHAKAKVELRAFHRGGNIYIEIEDDGRGLNKAVIRQRAIEKEVISADDDLSDKEIFALIFAPGFSTAEKVTEVSGRGVGMDVVRRNIEALRGTINISSEEGKGSTFSIQLPLTLAIIDGMVISIADEKYIIPTLSIVTSVSIKKENIKSVQHRGEMFDLQGELIPLFHLDKLFKVPNYEHNSDDCLVVVVESDGVKTGIIIDELIGQQQTVIKNLGEYLKNIQGISGGAIMADGAVGLIIDVASLVKGASK